MRPQTLWRFSRGSRVEVRGLIGSEFCLIQPGERASAEPHKGRKEHHHNDNTALDQRQCDAAGIPIFHIGLKPYSLPSCVGYGHGCEAEGDT
jgi:hypothetical protein